MPRRRTPLAKLTRPRLHSPVARERLFTLLDAKREHSLVWVAGPPGAGKTTLVASYCAARRFDGLWYQLDPEDGDPATFFYYLGLAARNAVPRAKPLPLLTPEYLPDVEGFTRRWFRALFHSLPLGSVVVLDNYHELPAESAVHRVIAVATREVPPGAVMAVVSRGDPPQALAGALANQLVGRIGWDELRLTAHESESIAASRGETDAAVVRQLHAQCDGWAAGLTLMVDRLQRYGELKSFDPSETRDAVFDYFASEVFEGASAEMRRVLLHTAFFPRVTVALADAASATATAGAVLEQIYRRHLFTERRGGEEPYYQYHPLFQTFLRNEARRLLAPEAYAALMERTAQLLSAAGHHADAFALHVEAADWPAATALLLDQAPELLRQGRWKTLQEWAQRIPEPRRAGNAFVDYWVARSRLLIDPGAARPLLEHVYQAFVDVGDETAQLLSGAAVLEALYYEFRDYKLMDGWIERVARLLERGIALPTLEDDLRVHATLMMAATYRAPDHPMLKRWARRAAELVAEPLDTNLRVATVSMLHVYANTAADFEAEQFALHEGPRLLAMPEVSAPRAAFCIASEGYTHYVAGRYFDALACFDRADAIAHEQGLDEWLWISGLWRGLSERRAGLLQEAEATVARLSAMRLQPVGLRAAIFALLKAVVAFDRGDTAHALASARVAQDIAEKSGQFMGGTLLMIVTANIAIGSGEFGMAADSLQRMRARVSGPVSATFLGAVALNEAWLAHRQGDAVTRSRLLREALERAADAGARMRMHWYPNALSELLPISLAQGIEPDMARRLAREFGVRPRPADVEDWPWPVCVRVLGPFELLVNGAPPAFSRKMPKKALALLGAIIAFGGIGVPEQRVLDALWPDDEGDAAHRSLTTTVRRLRDILGQKEAVRHAGGKVHLDPDRCWVDAWSFEQALEGVAAAADVARAIELYRGGFLDEEEDARWAVPMRERLRGKFIQAVVAAAGAYERDGRYDDAIRCYLRGMDADNLVETFYQGLMRCYDQLQRRTEAVSTYRRLRQVLSVTLGVAPSAVTEQLYQSLRAN